MKLLLDENLSRRLVQRIADLFPDSVHVGTEGLLQTPDCAVWEFAKSNGFSIATADADFYELATTLGPPNWTNADAGVTTGADGSFLWTDTQTITSLGDSVYYRISYP